MSKETNEFFLLIQHVKSWIDRQYKLLPIGYDIKNSTIFNIVILEFDSLYSDTGRTHLKSLLKKDSVNLDQTCRRFKWFCGELEIRFSKEFISTIKRKFREILDQSSVNLSRRQRKRYNKQIDTLLKEYPFIWMFYIFKIAHSILVEEGFFALD